MKKKVAYIYLTTCIHEKYMNMKYIGSRFGFLDDNYLGSGTNIRKAIKDIGKEYFFKEILEILDNPRDRWEIETKYLQKYEVYKSSEYFNKTDTAYCLGFVLGDKHTQESIEKLCDEWEVITPNNETLIIKNMLSFCRENNLNPSAMSSVARGNRRHYKGYKCRKLTNNRNVIYEYKEWKSKPNLNQSQKFGKNGWSKKIMFRGKEYDSLSRCIYENKLSRWMILKEGKYLE